MKRALLFVGLALLCGVRLLPADQTIRSLQQTLKDQGFYYGTVTGDKSAETTAAIRRYQIRNGLQVTGELNEETLRSVNSSSNSVASASQPASKPAAIQPNSVRPDASARLSQSSPPPSFNQPNLPLETNPPYSASFYQSAPLRVNRRCPCRHRRRCRASMRTSSMKSRNCSTPASAPRSPTTAATSPSADSRTESSIST